VKSSPGEDPVDVARREFQEELGTAAGQPLRALGEIRQRGGKRVIAFAVEGNLDADAIASNTFEMEWPPPADGAHRLNTTPHGVMRGPWGLGWLATPGRSNNVSQSSCFVVSSFSARARISTKLVAKKRSRCWGRFATFVLFGSRGGLDRRLFDCGGHPGH
jgi:predicted NUDIX family NTP pyrophosphohydrolase